jgi:hypothetical protein
MNQSTPWGKSDYIKKYTRGIAFLATPGHGGFRVSKKLALKKIPAEMIRVASINMGNYFWFEEDCAWSVVAISFPEVFPDLIETAKKSFDRWYSPRITTDLIN